MRNLAKFFFQVLFWVTFYKLVTKTADWEGPPYGYWVAFYLIAVILCFFVCVSEMGCVSSSNENSKEKRTAFSIRFFCIGLALIYLGFAWYNFPTVVEKRMGLTKLTNDINLYQARRNAYPTPKNIDEKLWVLEGERDMKISQIRSEYYFRIKKIDPTYGEKTIVSSLIHLIVGLILLGIAILPQRFILFLFYLIITDA